MFQIVNIVAGFLLASPKIKEWVKGGAVHIEHIESRLNAFRTVIGIFVFVLGLTALIERLNLHWFSISGASFPQAIPLVLMGLLFAPQLFAKFPAVNGLIAKLAPHAEWIGIASVAIGLGSLTVGCIAPACYHLNF